MIEKITLSLKGLCFICGTSASSIFAANHFLKIKEFKEEYKETIKRSKRIEIETEGENLRNDKDKKMLADLKKLWSEIDRKI